MSGTALDHPLVRRYLRELDAAFAALPAGQARELREQITAHLDEALPIDADDQEVAAVLRQLGSPGDLAAEAAPVATPATQARTAAAGQRSRPARRSPARRSLARLSRLGWRGWAPIAAAVVVVCAVLGYVVAVAAAAPIQFNGAASWWYARDSARAVYTEADGAQQTTVPIRSGQRQGFVITVDNPSDWTQTVLGPVAGDDSPGSLRVQIGVATADPYHGGGVFRPLTYALPESIPPHQTRALRVLWTSAACLVKGSSEGIDRLSLRVRVGWITRTEVVQLGQGWFLAGPSRGRCS